MQPKAVKVTDISRILKPIAKIKKISKPRATRKSTIWTAIPEKTELEMKIQIKQEIALKKENHWR